MSKGYIYAIIASVMLLTLPTVLIRCFYPYGRRPSTVAGMITGMDAFALSHNGWLPKSDFGPYEALRQLYASNCTALELAGITGNAALMEKALTTGGVIDSNVTSWVYIQGFKSDDPQNLCVLWESRPGFSTDGRRTLSHGHLAIFLSGCWTNIPSSHWDTFVEAQANLRANVLAKRAVR